MRAFFGYWFWPRLGGWHYMDTKVQLLLAGCVALIVASFVLSYWRKRLSNPVTKKLSSGWSTASLWFGIVALFFVVCRVEDIQFLQMRALWAAWVLCLVLYVVFQFVQFSRRHYTVIKQKPIVDERDKYLPKKKR